MKKLDHKWASPFTITKVISPAAIKLCLYTQDKNIHPVISISSVCPYVPDDIAEHPQPPQPGPIIVNDQEEYEVKEVLDSRFRWGKLWYLVKFIGWSHSDNMWLPHLEVHALAVVEEFHLQHPDSPHYSSPSTLTTLHCPRHRRRATLLQDVVDGEECRTMHQQPKQSKTLPVQTQGGAGYETEADFWYQAQQAADTLSKHTDWSQAPKLVTGT